MRRVVPLLIVFVCLLAPAVAGAGAKGGKKLIQDCADDGEVNGTYAASDFTYALKHLPTDLDEYTNCRAEIERAQLAAAGRRPGGGGGSGAGPLGGGALGDLSTPTPQEKAAIAQAARRPQAVRVAGQRISPGGRGLLASSRAHSPPTSLLLLLILIALAVLARAAVTVRSRVLARRQA